MIQPRHVDNPDIILIGSGVMSANLGAILKRLEPNLAIQLYEAADMIACECSDGWNNAGTGHAGICELSYTPHRNADGSVNVTKAIEIFEQFSLSKRFWSFAVADGMIDRPKDFINPIPHLSFVHGEEQVDFLRARHEEMSAHHFFREMEFSTDRAEIARWAPLLLDGRGDVPIGATKMDAGTDVNFGALSRKLIAWLSRQPECGVVCGHRVVGLGRSGSGWRVRVKELATKCIRENQAGFVFIGAGGGSLPLLQKSGIEESKGVGGFPIGGQWLVCDNSEIVKRHHAKVYGQPFDAAPTMAVPHLDTRVIDGKRTLLFGPFAAWSTRFLHTTGSWTDLPRSVRPDNFATLCKVAIDNLDLVKYLIQQGMQSMSERMSVLHVFYPGAQAKDWRLIDAGIRVQAIKTTDAEAGIVHYGTELITNSERNIAALLGASPGASVSVSIALDVITKCLPGLVESEAGSARLASMIPTYFDDTKCSSCAQRFMEVEHESDTILQLRTDQSLS